MSNDVLDFQRSRWKGGVPILLGFLGLGLLGGILGYWGFSARIAGAIIANGMIQVENNRQVIQHPDGGVVGEILAKDGDQVAAGDVLLRLDRTFLQSELTVVEGQLFELMARRVRLEAERDELSDLDMSDELIQIATDSPSIQVSFDIQRRLFLARKNSRSAELEQLARQREQLESQISGVGSELEALHTQLGLISNQRKNKEILFQKQIVSANEISEIRIEQASIQGIIGRLKANVSGIEAQISSLNIQELKLAISHREEAIDKLSDLSFRERELAERRSSLKERLSRLDVRTPVGGMVFGSTVFALKSVLQPAEPLMFIIPQDQPLIISARIESIHIDQLRVGQEATLRFLSFDQRRTPEMKGMVSKLSADALPDEFTGESFYQAELVPDATDLLKLEGQRLLPGMPVEIFIKTGERSPINYLTKPLTDYFTRAFRES